MTVNPADSTLSILFAICSMVAFGCADFTAKVLLRNVSVYRTVFLSQLIGFLPFLGIALAYDFAAPDQTLLALAALSGLLSAILLFSLYKALSLGRAMLVMPICSCQTIVAVVLSIVILRETLSGLQTCLIAGVFFGILLVAVEQSKATSISKMGLAYTLVVVIVGGGVTIFQKWVSISSHPLIGFMFIRLFMVVGLATLFLKFDEPSQTPIPPKGYVAIAFLGVLETVAFFATFMGFRAGFVSIVSPIANSSAAITVILARIILKERIVFHQKIGVLAIIVCIALLSAIS
jgi:drug/metabolite transporter (DMT)-like permease